MNYLETKKKTEKPRLNEHLTLFFIIIVFLVCQLFLYKPMLSDENNYFYLGKLVSEHKVPYRDFYFAHPSFQLFVFGGIIRIFGYNFLILKSIALLSTGFTAILIYFILLKKGISKLSANLAVMMFLFANTVFFVASVNFGVNLATVLLVWGYYLIDCDDLWLGILFSFAMLTGLYTVPIIAIILIYRIITKQQNKPIYVGLSLFILYFGLETIVLKGANISQYIFYHTAAKGSMGFWHKLMLIPQNMQSNYLIWLPFIIASITIILTKKRSSYQELWVLLGFLGFILLLKYPFHYYFIVVYPFIVMLSMRYFYSLGSKFSEFVKVIMLGGFCVLLLISTSRNIRAISNHNAIYSFDKLDELSGFVSQKPGTVLGDYHIAPLVALETGKTMVYSPNIDTYPWANVDDSLMVDSLLLQKPSIFLVHKLGQSTNPLWHRPEINHFLNQYCGFNETPRYETWEDNSINHYEVYFCDYEIKK